LDCKNECPLECSSISYELLATVSEYPTRSYFQYLQKNEQFQKLFQITGSEKLTYERAKERIVSLNIYINELAFTEISELKKMTLVDLLANLGGKFSYFQFNNSN
jgi:hypothetical protein